LAHQTAVDNSARTIAVLGTGLDKKNIYPQTNVVLADKIVENGGLLIGEYPPETHGARYTFARRDRIISGLSLATLVIEAKEKSGALITAEWARKQGKTVFAVPGSIYAANSRGCHYLIKHGAKLIDCASDILEELKIESRTEAKTLNLFGDNAEESKILESLKEGALETDKIIIKTGLPAKSILSTLPVLEIKGKIKDLGNNIYALGNR
jgi:DNA processing protein